MPSLCCHLRVRAPILAVPLPCALCLCQSHYCARFCILLCPLQRLCPHRARTRALALPMPASSPCASSPCASSPCPCPPPRHACSALTLPSPSRVSLPISSHGNLPGAGDLYIKQYKSLFQSGKYNEAAKIAVNSPRVCRLIRSHFKDILLT